MSHKKFGNKFFRALHFPLLLPRKSIICFLKIRFMPLGEIYFFYVTTPPPPQTSLPHARSVYILAPQVHDVCLLIVNPKPQVTGSVSKGITNIKISHH